MPEGIKKHIIKDAEGEKHIEHELTDPDQIHQELEEQLKREDKFIKELHKGTNRKKERFIKKLDEDGDEEFKERKKAA